MHLRVLDAVGIILLFLVASGEMLQISEASESRILRCESCVQFQSFGTTVRKKLIAFLPEEIPEKRMEETLKP